jgi:hypothetical protein
MVRGVGKILIKLLNARICWISNNKSQWCPETSGKWSYNRQGGCVQIMWQTLFVGSVEKENSTTRIRVYDRNHIKAVVTIQGHSIVGDVSIHRFTMRWPVIKVTRPCKIVESLRATFTGMSTLKNSRV